MQSSSHQTLSYLPSFYKTGTLIASYSSHIKSNAMTQYTFLQDTLNHIITNGTLPIEQVCFGHSDFLNPQSKETLYLYKGNKEYFCSIELFWIHSLFQIELNKGKKKSIMIYLQQFLSTLHQIDQQLFFQLIEAHTKNLKYKFNIQKNIFNHYSLRNSWNNVILVGEKENQYILFYWQDEN